MSSSPAFELQTTSLKLFQRAVLCLSKLGRDAAVIFRPDELILHGSDDAHSAAIQFAFRRNFFCSTPASAIATVGGTVLVQEIVVVGAKALLVALRGSQQRGAQSDSLILRLARSRQQCLILEFTRGYGTVRHKVPLLETVPFLPGEPAAGPHAAALAPSLLARVLEHCAPPSRGGGFEEVTVSAVPSEGLRVQSNDIMLPGHERESHRTEVLVQMSDLEACNLDARGGEVSFAGRAMRDFSRAAEAMTKDLEHLGILSGSALLEIRFGSQSSSVVCRIAVACEGLVKSPEDFSAVLIICTRDLLADQSPVPGTQGVGASTPTPAASQARRAQPRQGPKRRTLEASASAEAFHAFPDASASQAIPASQVPSTPLPPTQPTSTATQGTFVNLQSAQPLTQPPLRLRPPVPARIPAPVLVVPSPVVVPQPAQSATSIPSAAPLPVLGASGAWFQGGLPPPPQILSSLSAATIPTLASNLGRKALNVEDSDDDFIGADPDEVAFARGDDNMEDSADWFDAEKLW